VGEKMKVLTAIYYLQYIYETVDNIRIQAIIDKWEEINENFHVMTDQPSNWEISNNA
tara:strand:- start:2438 stop:2608 length:171 start_codon:yes stop_codon:yes gene_type:complete